MFETTHLAPILPTPPRGFVHLHMIGRFQSLGDFRWEQVATRTALHFIQEGRGWFEEDGNRFRAVSGDVVRFQSGRHYRYWDDAANPWKYDFLIVLGQLPEGELPDAVVSPGHPRSWRAVEQAVAEFGASHMTLSKAALLAWQVIETLSAPNLCAAPDLMLKISALIERRDAVFPSVQHLADHFGMDRSTLYRRVRAETGQSIKTWMDAKRIERAKELLQRSNAPVKDIAMICGFRDPLYFSRAFRQATGLPPGEWRGSSDAP